MRRLGLRIGFSVLSVVIGLIAAGERSAPVAHAQPSLVNCPPLFLGDYPSLEADWTDDIQGITHDGTHWYLTQTLDLLRIPVGRDLDQDHKGEPGVSHRQLSSYPELSGYDHLGDMDHIEVDGTTYILLSVDSGPGDGLVAAVRSDASLDLVNVAAIPGQGGAAGWLAVDPDGFLYSSTSTTSELRKYSVDWENIETGFTVTFIESIPLSDENGDGYTLNDMQGGVVTPDGGTIFLTNGFDDCDNETYGLHAFNLRTGQRIIRSCQSGCDFRFQFDVCDVGFLDEEPEGLTFWDLDGGGAPGVEGQLHVLLLNNDILTDNVFLKHYRLDTMPPAITCPEGITVECEEAGGTPASHPDIAAFLDGAVATDDCDDEPTITDDAPAFFPLGTTTVTFTATDDALNEASCQAEVTIVDTTAPSLQVTLDRDVLWPPNHKLVEVCATVEVDDACDAGAGFELHSITSDEPDNGRGDGNTSDDIQNAVVGTPDRCFDLRSERRGMGDGGKYTIVYRAFDASGNETFETVCVRVPHDRSAAALAATGFTADGRSFDPTASAFVVVLLSDDPIDATSIDPATIYLGNTAGAVRPKQVRPQDVDRDGDRDLAVYFSIQAASLVRDPTHPTGNGMRGGGRLEEGRWDGPLGVHFVTPAGEDRLVADIFALGSPVTLEEGRSIEQPERREAFPGATGFTSIHPNPFNPQTTLRFALASSGSVNVSVFDVSGALVRRLVAEFLPPGEHSVHWNGVDEAGRAVASGTYFAHLTAGDQRQTRKIVLLK